MGQAAMQPIGSSSAQDPGVWMWSVTDTCPPLSLLGFVPQYFHDTPCAERRFREAVLQGQMDTVLFQVIPAGIPLHEPWEEPLEPKAMAKGAVSPTGKAHGQDLLSARHLQCQQGPGAPCTLTLCCLFLVFRDRLSGEKE